MTRRIGMIKLFESFDKKYNEVDCSDIRKIFEKLGGLNDLDVRALISFLREKYLNKRVKIEYDDETYNFLVKKIRIDISTTNKNNNLWRVYFSDNITKSYIEIAPGLDDKIYILENRIISKEDPYGEENWDE
jgi:hypothetical protein